MPNADWGQVGQSAERARLTVIAPSTIDPSQPRHHRRAYIILMARPLRIEFSGALYHVTARGDRRGCIYVDDLDRTLWLDILAMVCSRFRFTVYAYCLMSNHFHLLVETPHGQLSAGMRQLNGVYSQAFNRRHQLVGHVFQGRYGAVLCEKEVYLKELARYIVLNPLRARMVSSLDDWPWSSHALMMGHDPEPSWFDSCYLLSLFNIDIEAARASYLAFTLDGLRARRPLDYVQHQLLLGAIPQARDRECSRDHLESSEISRTNKAALLQPLATYFGAGKDIKQGIIDAYATRAFAQSEIARACGLSRRTVCRIIKSEKAGQLILK